MTRKIFILLVVSITAASAQAAPQESQECADAKAQASRLQSRLQDWPALARYRDANAGEKAPAKDEKRVVFMGEGNLASRFELARANNIRVVVASVLPVSDYGKNREGNPVTQTTRRPPEKIKALNEWIKTYATQNGLT